MLLNLFDKVATAHVPSLKLVLFPLVNGAHVEGLNNGGRQNFGWHGDLYMEAEPLDPSV